MLSSISPLGERARGNRFLTTASAHVIGAVVGGALIGAVAGAVGALALAPVDRETATIVGLGAMAAAAVVALALDRRGVPTIRRQVDERWLDTYRGWVYGLGYGFQLGLGVVTIVTSALVYAALAGAAATGSVLGGAVVGGAFGAARGAAILLTVRVRTPEQLARVHRRVVSGERAACRLAGTGAAIVGAAALALAVGQSISG